LLDTHILLWIFLNPDKISPAIKKIINDDENYLSYSTASLEEISIKCSLGKLDLIGNKPEDIRLYAIKSDFDELVLSGDLVTSLYQLPTKANHRDPFDRLLIWQAIKQNLILISADEKFEQYEADGLRLVQNE
jgi:PIN domain nuclease of toxin-antitoxin system